MNREQLIAFMRSRTAELIDTIEKKNADYVGGHADPFFNFKAVELLDVCSAEVGLLTRLTDKFMRIRSFVKNGTLHVKSESVTDTLIDQAAYSLLMAALIESRKRTEEKKAPVVKALLYSFSPKTPELPPDTLLFASAEKRAGDDWVLLFQHGAIDAIRADSLDALIAKAEARFGPAKLNPAA